MPQFKQKDKMRNNSANCRMVSGSFTIEAAYIMPIIIFTIIAIIYFTIYLYNLTLFQSRINSAVAAAEELFVRERNPYTGEIDYDNLLSRSAAYMFFASKDDKKQLLTEYLKAKNEQGYVFSDIENWQIEYSTTKITIRADMIMNISLPNIFLPLDNKLKTTTLECSTDLLGREEKQRIYSVIKDTVHRIKGADELLDRIKEFFSKLGG